MKGRAGHDASRRVAEPDAAPGGGWDEAWVASPELSPFWGWGDSNPHVVPPPGPPVTCENVSHDRAVVTGQHPDDGACRVLGLVVAVGYDDTDGLQLLQGEAGHLAVDPGRPWPAPRC